MSRSAAAIAACRRRFVSIDATDEGSPAARVVMVAAYTDVVIATCQEATDALDRTCHTLSYDVIQSLRGITGD